MRSKLFVPGSRPEWFAKALDSLADAVSIDLEDSVIEDRKAEARGYVADFLASDFMRSSVKVMIVRCNATGTPHFAADIMAIARPQLEIINLPKVESAGDVRAAVDVLERAEAANGVAQPIRLLASIESAGGLRRAAEIASSHSRLCGLQLGLGDLFDTLSVDRKDIRNVHAAMFAMRMAAAEAGVFAYDSAYADIANEDGFCAEAVMSRRLGYWGKSCVHPRQVRLANEVFTPSADELDFAARVLEASCRAEATGLGAFTVDEQMIDLPAIRRAQLIVAAGERTLDDG